MLVHGMGACHETWNKLLRELDTNRYTAYAIDLLGFGDSDKPAPAQESEQLGHLYNYDTWSSQIGAFVEQVRDSTQVECLPGRLAVSFAMFKRISIAAGSTDWEPRPPCPLPPSPHQMGKQPRSSVPLFLLLQCLCAGGVRSSCACGQLSGRAGSVAGGSCCSRHDARPHAAGLLNEVSSWRSSENGGN